MRKVLPAVSTVVTYLFVVSGVYAQNVPLNDPSRLAQRAQPEKIPQLVINWIFYLGIFLAIVYLMYGGIRWITSGGDKTKVEAARKNIIAAIVGLIVVAGAFLILRVVLVNVLGLSDFKICIPTLANPDC